MLVRNMENSDYHAVKEGADFSVSSSQLKDALKSSRAFYNKYIAKTTPKEESTAFDIGTAIHTSILEPEKFSNDIAIYEGIRNGAKWEKFKADNANKTIVIKSEISKVLTAVAGYEKSEEAKRVRNANGVECELSCFLKLEVGPTQIYLPTPEWYYVLTKNGWRPTDEVEENRVSFTAKTRADIINVVDGYIGDVKSTSEDAQDVDDVLRAISTFQYDMSAAYYLDIFAAQSLLDWESLETPRYFDWIFTSTNKESCAVYRSTEPLLQVGRAKWRRAVLKIANGFRTNWEGMDKEIINYVPVSKYDVHWLEEWK